MDGKEDSAAGYPGAHIGRRADGPTHLAQLGLTQRIAKALHLGCGAAKPAPTPPAGYLAVGAGGERAEESFSYPSAAGQLSYLQGHSRPGISMAVAQAARHARQPRRPRKQALARIGRCQIGRAHV